MMKLLINMTFLLLLITSISCKSTPDKKRLKTPKAEYSSSCTAMDVADCIADKWKSDPELYLNGWGPSPFRMAPMDNGYFLEISSPESGTVILVDIIDTGTGSSTSYWESMTWSDDKYRNVINNCQNAK